MMVRGIISACARVAGRLTRFSASGRTGETIANRELMQQYGFASEPPVGSQAVWIKRGNHIICIATEKPDLVPDKTALQDWKSVLYSDPTHYIMIKHDGSIVVKAEKVTVDAGEINLGPEAAAALGGGVVTGMCSCSYTGGPHPVKSMKVKAQL